MQEWMAEREQQRQQPLLDPSSNLEYSFKAGMLCGGCNERRGLEVCEYVTTSPPPPEDSAFFSYAQADCIVTRRRTPLASFVNASILCVPHYLQQQWL